MEKGCNTSCCSSSSGLSVSDKKSSPNSLFVTNSTTKICMPGGTHGGGGENLGRSKNPFGVYNPFAHSTIPLYNKSPGDSSMGEGYEYHPFTNVQWKELERQAMIYKYMISSVPVPLDLLFPPPIINSSPPPPPNNYPPAVLFNNNNNVSRYSKTGDLEPGRCKRTDGKKWRCSRDVAPTQKYCDRHLHRGRPRSRKPVETPTTTTTTTLPLNNNNNNIILNPHKKIRTSHHQIVSANANSNPNPNPYANEPLLFFNPPKSDLTNRGLVLNDVVLEGKEGFSDYRPIFHEDYSQVFCNQNFSPPEIEVPNNGFIDAWSSIDDYNLNSSSNGGGGGSNLNVQSLNDGDLSPTLLNLTIGSRVKESVWFAGGGPLGEALSSPAATTVSSPSGVLQRTMFSHSDGGSVCNSPTTFAADAPLHWLN